MNMYLGYPEQWLIEQNGIHTAKEISHQPKLWRKLVASYETNKTQITEFLSPILLQSNLRIILTGAGTSAFVGETVAPFIQDNNKYRVEAIPTTDLVSNPAGHFDPSRPTLLVSYARSGNSPESVAAVQLAEQCLPNCYHFILTCNPDGALSQYASKNKHAFCFLMPEGSNDKSFAMTSSFSCMLMGTLLLFGGMRKEELLPTIEAISHQCEIKMSQWLADIKSLAQLPYQRLIVIGSGGFAGLAQEAALKSLELSAGQVMTAFDSSLGFRHGPKFTLNANAVVIQFIASEYYTRQYDLDLYKELQSDNQVARLVAITAPALDGEHVYELGQSDLGDMWLCFPFVLFCQILAFEKSLQLGLGPDNPCPTGEVNRVVQGVTIHPYITNNNSK